MFLGSVWKENHSFLWGLQRKTRTLKEFIWPEGHKADLIGREERQGRKEKVAAQLSGSKFWISYCSSAALQGFRLAEVQVLSMKDIWFCGTISPGFFFWLPYFQTSLRKQTILPARESHPISKLAEVVSGALNCQRQTSLEVKNFMWDTLVTLQTFLTDIVLFLKYEN